MSTWITSSACTVGSCVEVRHVDGHVEVRDNTAPDTVLHITPADWALFLVGAKAGEFDGPAANDGQAPATYRPCPCSHQPNRAACVAAGCTCHDTTRATDTTQGPS